MFSMINTVIRTKKGILGKKMETFDWTSLAARPEPDYLNILIVRGCLRILPGEKEAAIFVLHNGPRAWFGFRIV